MKGEIKDCHISFNSSEEMMKITDKKGKCVFYGNYWDFRTNPGAIAKFLESLGLVVGFDKNLKSV